MASDEPSGSRPAPVVLRIKLRYDDVDAMVQRFAPNVGRSGLFLPTKSLQAVGAEVKFELRLANDTPVLVGLGRVKAAKAPDPANPKAAFGMAIELMRVTRESREVIMKMLERRKALGLPELGIPHPADIDAARRSGVDDTSVKTTAVPAAVPMIDSAQVLSAQISPDSGPVMTAPRRNTGPLAIAKAHVVAPLEPEAPRKKRAALSEVIERASGPIAVGGAVHVPGLDDEVDIGAVLARARTLAGGNLDEELEALRELSAAPIEIGIEAASAELAKQLGGAAVRRDRSAKWAPPPSTISAAVEAKAEPIIEPGPAPEPQPHVEPEPVLRDSVPMIDVEPDSEDSEEPEDAAHEVDADQIADEIHQLQDGDVEEVEHTQIGALPMDPGVDPDAFDQHVFATEPEVTADLERSLNRHLADAEAEAGDLGLAVPEREEEAEEEEEEIHDFEILAEADAADADLLTAHGEQEASGRHEIGAAEPEPPSAPEHLEDEHPHIPARIRAQHRRVSGQHEIIRGAPPVHLVPEPDLDPGSFNEPEPRPSLSDFAARLDLGDELEAVHEASGGAHMSDLDQALGELDPRSLGELDPRSLSAGHALAAFEDPDRGSSQFDEPASFDPPGVDGESDSSFTLPGELPVASIEFVPQSEQPPGFPPLHSFDSSDVIQPKMLSKAPGRAAQVGGAESYDLETALEALDVDLDDLSIPHDPVFERQRQARAERVVPKRAGTDIPIDFDDFEEE